VSSRGPAAGALEKLVFLFPRKQGLSRDEFFDHYLRVHAPLGLELTRTMVHYTVNLRDRVDDAPPGVDAITETWTGSIADFMNPERSFASPEEAQRLMDDHNSFIGDPYDVYAVDERVRKGASRAAPADGPSPGDKLVVAITDASGEAIRRMATLVDRDDVTRYVENAVTSALASSAFGAVAAFVELNVVGDGGVVANVEQLVGDEGVVYRVSEYVRK
jgi:hypothetical protein